MPLVGVWVHLERGWIVSNDPKFRVNKNNEEIGVSSF